MAMMTISLRLMGNRRGDYALLSGPTTVRHVRSTGGRYAPGGSGGPDPAAGGGRG
jgi:hypothetical protein